MTNNPKRKKPDGGVPAWCNTPELRDHWKRPWKVPIDGRKARVFKKRLREHGLLSPHFSIKECSSKDGVTIPDSLLKGAQRQAFRMEKYRHANGDKPIGFLSWYRSPPHNAAEGGASESRHMKADATDRTFENTSLVLKIWNTGGIGWAGPGVGRGSILHTDSRPGPHRAEWAYS